MATKYQVFISSTYGDLKDERDRVIQGILELGHIPVGMEMFSAADEAQWQIIARHIDESDYYVVIVGHRYGSIVDDISYTRKEYEYAVSRGVPIIGFVIDPKCAWPADRVDTEPTAVAKLQDFKALVEQKPVGHWKTADDLYGQSTVALVKAIATNPRVGWVRANTVLGPEITVEISRLSAENAQLRESLAAAQVEAARDSEKELEGLRAILTRNKVNYSIRVRGQRDWIEGHVHDLETLFRILSPVMLVESSIDQICRLVAINSLTEEQDEDGLSGETIPTNSAGVILADFMALDLMAPSTKRHAVSDTKDYWSLTQLGHDLRKHISRKRLEAGQPIEDTADASAGPSPTEAE